MADRIAAGEGPSCAGRSGGVVPVRTSEAAPPAIGFRMTLLLLVLPASAADFTVRTDGTGDYSRLQACANAVAPGDRCVVTGSFDERVRVRTSGEEALPISFVADGVASVRAFSLDGASHLVIEGFDITHDGMSSDGDSSVLIAGATDVRIEGNTVHDTDATCIELDPNAASSSVVIRGNTITRCGFASSIWLIGTFTVPESVPNSAWPWTMPVKT